MQRASAPMTDEQRRARKAAYMREWNRKNRDRINARRRELDKRPEIAERNRAYRLANSEKVREWDRQKRIRDKEKIAARKKADWAKNRERYHQRQADYYQRNRERIIAKAKEWSDANRDRIKARQKIRRDTDASRTYQRLYQQYRRGIKRGAPGRFTQEQIQARIDYYGGKCYLCRAPYEHLDHVIPLSRGGSNWPANIRPACESCNCRKHNKTLAEFRAA